MTIIVAMLVLLTLIPTGWKILLAFSDLLESLTRHLRCRNR
jgi:hypothetical protein